MIFICNAKYPATQKMDPYDILEQLPQNRMAIDDFSEDNYSLAY